MAFRELQAGMILLVVVVVVVVVVGVLIAVFVDVTACVVMRPFRNGCCYIRYFHP